MCVFYASHSEREIVQLVAAHPKKGETHKTVNSCHSLGCTRGNGSIIYFTDLCKPIKRHLYGRKRHQFTSYPAAKHPKHNKFAITDM